MPTHVKILKKADEIAKLLQGKVGLVPSGEMQTTDMRDRPKNPSHYSSHQQPRSHRSTKAYQQISKIQSISTPSKTHQNWRLSSQIWAQRKHLVWWLCLRRAKRRFTRVRSVLKAIYRCSQVLNRQAELRWVVLILEECGNGRTEERVVMRVRRFAKVFLPFRCSKRSDHKV